MGKRQEETIPLVDGKLQSKSRRPPMKHPNYHRWLPAHLLISEIISQTNAFLKKSNWWLEGAAHKKHVLHNVLDSRGEEVIRSQLD
jgi:hypothetical protein